MWRQVWQQVWRGQVWGQEWLDQTCRRTGGETSLPPLSSRCSTSIHAYMLTSIADRPTLSLSWSSSSLTLPSSLTTAAPAAWIDSSVSACQHHAPHISHRKSITKRKLTWHITHDFPAPHIRISP